MSAPHVAGAAALLKQFQPEWSPAQIKAALIGTAKDIGIDINHQGAGRIRILDAVNISFISLPSQLSLGNQSLPLTNITAYFNLSELSNVTYNVSLSAFLRTGSTPLELNASTFELSQLDNGSVMFVINLTGTNPATYDGLITANSSETNITIPFWLVTHDPAPPAWSGNVTSIPTTYSSTTLSIFNITWIDLVNLGTVLLESNFSGSPTNYTMGNLTNTTYNFSRILPAGSHYWKSYANDTSNNRNQTISWAFSIAKATPTLNLTINGTEGAVTINEDSAIWLNGSLVTGDGGAILTLFRDGVQQNNGTSVSNLTTFDTPGTFNISLNYTTTENYTAAMASYFVTVLDITPPAYSNEFNFTVTTFDNSTQLFINLTWTDNNNLSGGVTISVNRSGVITNYSASNVSDVTYNLTLGVFPAGTHYWRSNATDGAGNTNTTSWLAFTIAEATPMIVLDLNGTSGAVTINEDSAIWLNGSVTAGDSNYNLTLWIDSTKEYSAIGSPITNYTTFATPGTFNVSLNYTQTQNYSYKMVSYLVTVLDITPPTYSNQFNFTNTTFDNLTQVFINLTWQDNNNLTGGVSIEVNRSGTSTVYQASNVSDIVWNLTLGVFPAGTHYWRSNATDGAGNTNTTDWLAFTITKNEPTIVLDLNGTSGAVTIDEDVAIWLNGSLVTGDSNYNLSLWIDSTLEYSAIGSAITNYTTFATPGTFNISLNYTTTENYTAAMASYFVAVGDTTPPSVTNLVPITGTKYFTNTSITVSADIIDNINVSAVWANVTWANGSELLNLSLGASPTYSGELSNRSETGRYNVTFFANDTSANLNNTETTWFNITEVPDTIPPSWANASSTPSSPVNYSTSTIHRFNVTWTDAYAFDTVLIEHNFTGTLTNYSVTTSTESVYYYNYSSIAVGSYVWRMYANDSSGNSNVTDQYAYNITKAVPVLNLTLNGTAGNVTLAQASAIWLNASVVTGDGGAILTRFLDGVSKGVGTSITNLTTFSSLGDFNISLNYTSTQNFTAGTASYVVTVVDVTAPVVQSHAPTGTITSSTTTLTATTDENGTCRYSTTADTSYANIGSVMSGGNTTSHTASLTGLTNGVKHYYLRCNNSLGLVSTTDYDANFIVSIPTSGGGGGGGGGGTTTVTTGTTATTVIVSVSKETGLKLTITKETIPISTIQVEVTDSATNVEITVTATDEKPESVEDPLLIEVIVKPVTTTPGVVSVSDEGEAKRVYKQVYKYLEIEHKNLEGKIKEVTLEFKVTKAWLADHDYEKSQVVLLRNIDSAWEELLTEIKKETAINVYYTSTTPGFSIFAIAVKGKKAPAEESSVEPPVEPPIQPPSEPPVEPPVKPPVEQPEPGRQPSPWLVVLVVSFLVIGGAATALLIGHKRHVKHVIRKVKHIIGKPPKSHSKILAFIKECREDGLSDTEIRETMLNSGWSAKGIDSALRYGK